MAKLLDVLIGALVAIILCVALIPMFIWSCVLFVRSKRTGIWYD